MWITFWVTAETDMLSLADEASWYPQFLFALRDAYRSVIKL